MADTQTAIPMGSFDSDNEEPEEEDTCRHIVTSGISGALIVKSSPLQMPVAVDAGMSKQHPTNAELVYPWQHKNLSAVSIISEPSMTMSTALLPSSLPNMKNNVCCGVNSPLGYGTNVEMQRRHSILRMSANKTCSSHGLRKSASVEFEFDHTRQQAMHSIYASTSSVGREPRRLTFEEKAELYRIRPDLEIGPFPFYYEKVAELKRRNRRRIVFAMFGGMISLVLLLLFFSMWEYND
ncbi:unnamed protein product [Peronospora belbahrii]|uniref:Uncharacterized protein n=1 Tax=Peronospora belbahrii TaxID=622444 RepID=A0AAU9L2T5_9STRA|nr:unnamed protein product [Peronospora belbahrii]